MTFPSLFLMRWRWERQTPTLLLSVQMTQTRSLSPFTLLSNLHKIFKPPRPTPNYMSLITVNIFPFFLACIRIKWFNFCSTQSFQLVERYNIVYEKSNDFPYKRIRKMTECTRVPSLRPRCNSTLNIRNVEDKRNEWKSRLKFGFPYLLARNRKQPYTAHGTNA